VESEQGINERSSHFHCDDDQTEKQKRQNRQTHPDGPIGDAEKQEILDHDEQPFDFDHLVGMGMELD
jgi:heme oxygenase